MAAPVPDVVGVWNNTAWSKTTVYPGVQLSGIQRYCHQKNYSTFTGAVGSVATQVDNIQWASLGQTALASMMPSFGGQNSLVNFILELKDFKNVFLSLTSRFTTRLNVIRAVLGFDWWDKPFRKIAKTHLSYQFGWKPFWNDIQSMFTAMVSLDRKLKAYQALANTDLQKHFSTTITSTSASESVYHYSGDISTPGNTGSTRFAGRTRVYLGGTSGVRYNATLRFRYAMPPELSSISGQVKAYLDSLGVQANPAILWNAIPFSFIVDWFINVSSWLNKLRIDNIRFKTEIRDFCHSAVFTRSVRYTTQAALYGVTSSSNIQTRSWDAEVTTDECLIRAFRRKTGIPDFLSSMQTSGLDWREFSLGGALVRANRR